MSTNKTQNYQLHSWLPQDEFHLTEINENFTKLDAATAGKADKSEVTAKPSLFTGSYVGAGTSLRIELGRKPRAVLIMSPPNYGVAGYGIGGEGYTRSGITVDDTGFTVYDSGSSNNFVRLLYADAVFFYVALC